MREKSRTGKSSSSPAQGKWGRHADASTGLGPPDGRKRRVTRLEQPGIYPVLKGDKAQIIDTLTRGVDVVFVDEFRKAARTGGHLRSHVFLTLCRFSRRTWRFGSGETKAGGGGIRAPGGPAGPYPIEVKAGMEGALAASKSLSFTRRYPRTRATFTVSATSRSP